MPRTPVYVCYHTGGDYARHAAELAESLDQLGLPHTIKQLPDVGLWVRNCAMKPKFIRDMLYDHPGQPVVYLDADARVRRRPELFYQQPVGVDLACHYLDGVELLSGTLYFGGTVASCELAEEWHDRCEFNPDVWDQVHLQQIVDHGRQAYHVAYLPESYCYIYDRGKLTTDQVVIEHLQESRRQRQFGR